MAAEARRLAPELSWAAVARPLRRRSRDALAVETAAPWCHDDPRRRFAHLGVDERRHRHVRARRPRRASPRARLLHRRHGPPAGRRRAASPSPTVSRSSWPAPRSGSSPSQGVDRRIAQPAGRGRPMARPARGRGLLGAQRVGVRHGRAGAPRGVDAPERPVVLRPRRRAALAMAAGDGLRRARRRRGARRRPAPRTGPRPCWPTPSSTIGRPAPTPAGRGPSRA